MSLTINVRLRHRVVKTDNSQYDVVDTYVGTTIGYYPTYHEAKAFCNELNDQYFNEIQWALRNPAVQLTMQYELRLES